MFVSVVAIPTLGIFLLFCCPCCNRVTDRPRNYYRKCFRPGPNIINAAATLHVATAPIIGASLSQQPQPLQTAGPTITAAVDVESIRAEPYPEPANRGHDIQEPTVTGGTVADVESSLSVAVATIHADKTYPEPADAQPIIGGTAANLDTFDFGLHRDPSGGSSSESLSTRL